MLVFNMRNGKQDEEEEKRSNRLRIERKQIKSGVMIPTTGEKHHPNVTTARRMESNNLCGGGHENKKKYEKRDVGG